MSWPATFPHQAFDTGLATPTIAGNSALVASQQAPVIAQAGGAKRRRKSAKSKSPKRKSPKRKSASPKTRKSPRKKSPKKKSPTKRRKSPKKKSPALFW